MSHPWRRASVPYFHRWSPPPDIDAPFTDDETAQEVAALLGEPAFTIHTSHRHNGHPMLPPSAVAAVGYWESCHGDNVPIMTADEIASLRDNPGRGSFRVEEDRW